MQRFFARIVGEEALFSPSEAHHLLDVMRLGEGDLFEVADEGEIYLAKLVTRNPLKVHLEKKVDENNELKSGLILAFSLLKGGHERSSRFPHEGTEGSGALGSFKEVT